MKNNAIDYLIELSENDKCNTWVSYVIKYFIENRGVIDDNAKNDLADYLLQRKEIPELKSPSSKFNSSNEKIILKKLNHHSGVNTLVEKRSTLIHEHSIARQQFEVFSKIPGTDSDTWTNFIKSGISYCEEFELEGECPYCHQSYDETSLEITKAYSKFIKDTTQIQLDCYF